MAETPPPKKRRLFRFSLRTLLLVMTVACVLLGWKMNEAHRRRKAVARVREMGGSVKFDFAEMGQVYFGTAFNPPPRPAPDWWVNLVGIEAVADVTTLHLDDVELTDKTLRAVVFPHLGESCPRPLAADQPADSHAFGTWQGDHQPQRPHRTRTSVAKMQSRLARETRTYNTLAPLAK